MTDRSPQALVSVDTVYLTAFECVGGGPLPLRSRFRVQSSFPQENKTMVRIRHVFAGALTALMALSVARAAPYPSPSAAIQAEVKRFFDESHLASATVRVTRNGKEVYSGSIGAADIEQHVAASPHTVYAIGSISKAFTAYCILALAQQGKLNLDAPVGSILAEIKGPPAAVTIRQLLVHIGGIPDYEPAVAKDEARTYTTQDILAVFNDKPLEFTPGTSFAYSNSDHYLLGMVIERVAHETYSQVLERLIFKPFGLVHTAYGARAPIIEWRARGYDVDDSGHLINAAPWSETVPFAAGGIVSTTADVDRFTEALVAGAGKGLLAHAFDHVRLKNGTELSYLPISLAEGRLNGHRYFWHAGSIDGFLSFSAIVPAEHLTFSMLLNTIDPAVSPYSLFHHIRRIVLGLPLVEKEVPLGAKEAARFMGRYQLFVLSALDGNHLMDHSYPAQFAFKSGHLMREPGVLNGTEKPLTYVGKDRFVAPDDPDQTYQFNEHNGVMHLAIDDVTPWGGIRVK